MAQQMTMFTKSATASFVAARPTPAQRRSAVAVRAGPYDAELIATAVSASAMRGAGGGVGPCLSRARRARCWRIAPGTAGAFARFRHPILF